MGYWCDDKPACMQKNILATALNTGGGKWIGHQPIFQIFATFPNIEKVQDKPACNPERHSAKANKVKVESESWFSENILAETIVSDTNTNIIQNGHALPSVWMLCGYLDGSYGFEILQSPRLPPRLRSGFVCSSCRKTNNRFSKLETTWKLTILFLSIFSDTCIFEI